MRYFLFISMITLLFTGCASVPVADQELTQAAKQFTTPNNDKAALYIYRTSTYGAALKKDIKIDGRCIGESVPKVFFYELVDANKEYTLSTESEFSPNKIKIFAKGGQIYFIKQYTKLGVFVAGANLTVVDNTTGQNAIQSLKLAQSGHCSK